MCPKAKPTETVLHRIELQQTERDALEMVAASITARNATASVENLTKGVGNLLTPILGASVAGISVALGLLSYYELYVVPNNKIATPKGMVDGFLDLFRVAKRMEDKQYDSAFGPNLEPKFRAILDHAQEVGYENLRPDQKKSYDLLVAKLREREVKRQQELEEKNTEAGIKTHQLYDSLSTEFEKVTNSDSI